MTFETGPELTKVLVSLTDSLKVYVDSLGSIQQQKYAELEKKVVALTARLEKSNTGLTKPNPRKGTKGLGPGD